MVLINVNTRMRKHWTSEKNFVKSLDRNKTILVHCDLTENNARAATDLSVERLVSVEEPAKTEARRTLIEFKCTGSASARAQHARAD